MFSRFTNRALSTLDIARREAERLKQDHLGTEHLLLGLLVEGSNIAAQVLQQREVDAKKVRTILFKLISPSPRYTSEGPLALTSQAQDAVQSALAAARTLGHDYVGPEHLLLGLLCVPVGPATHVLRQLELNPETLREDVLAALSAIPPLAEDRKGDPPPTEGEDTVPPGRPDQGAGVSFTCDPSLFRRVDEEPQAVETNQPSCERGPLVLEQAGALGREAVLLSLPVAEDLRHDYVGTEHLLLGLIDKASGPVAELLKEAMCDFEKAEASVLALIPPGGAAHEAALPFTPRFKRVVGSAKAAADARQHRHAPAEYLLLALLEEDKGTAYRILAELKVDPCSLRDKLLARLDSADALNETTDGRG